MIVVLADHNEPFARCVLLQGLRMPRRRNEISTPPDLPSIGIYGLLSAFKALPRTCSGSTDTSPVPLSSHPPVSFSLYTFTRKGCMLLKLLLFLLI